ncbi:MAG TPA: histidine kinase [Chitinophagaceae bacterium]|nr:histidine kinase [Chitinophagaceae bacterium]
MLRNKFLIVVAWLLLRLVCLAQHPNYIKIDSLKKRLPSLNGIEKIDCLNALCQEYWWPPRKKTQSDSVSVWAHLAYQQAADLNYKPGIASSLLALGVEEVYKSNFLSAEKYLSQSLSMFELLNNDLGVGWCNVWLGQSLYNKSDFKSALTCLKKSAYIFQIKGEWDGEAKASAWMGLTFAILGNYDSSYFYCSESVRLRQKMSDYGCAAASLMNMGHLYQIAGSNADALDYFRESFNYSIQKGVDVNNSTFYFEAFGNVFRALNSLDSSYYYLQRAVQIDTNNKMSRISFAETLLKKNNYDSALRIFLQPVEQFRKENNNWALMRTLLDIAKAYHGKDRDKEALPYALESLSMSQLAGTKQYVLEAYKLLPELYKPLGKKDTAYAYLQRYVALKDSVLNKQFLWNLSNYKEKEDFKRQTDELTLLDKENKLKEDKLKQETKLKWILIAGLLIAALSGLMIVKNLALKRKNDKLASMHRQAELQQHVTELEMQALRAQMNPHFIFNCLNSINRFILKNETEAASNYLTKFSRLIRMALTHSKKDFISLEDELEMLKLYLDMERLRFKDAFEYSITFKNSIDTGNVFVPPLLLQPFAENAIWHGLMHKDGHGHLDIELRVDNRLLTCTITDDGVGRNKAAEIKSRSAEKSKSMGLQITSERLALLNKETDQPTLFNIEDIINEDGKPAGTRVILKMNYKDMMEITS